MKLRRTVEILIACTFVFFVALNSNTTIVTNSKEYYAANSPVSTRELAMLASLVYEDVPNDNKYQNGGKGKGCIDKAGNLKKGCFYTAFNPNISDNYVKTLNGERVLPYVEGMSERKAKGSTIVSSITANKREDGEAYYFLDFATTQEMKDDNWEIYDFASEQVKGDLKQAIKKSFPNSLNFSATFDAVTFQKGNNYVIAFRGTDFPDLFEWIDDVTYALNGEHSEASLAYKYAQKIYGDIVEKDSNAQIYVTGHSLGAYLAQIAGAAIVDYEAGIEYPQDGQYGDIKNIEDYTKRYAPKVSNQSKLVQVAYFNGMGAGGLIFNDSTLVDHVQDSLVYLSTHNQKGEKVNSGRSLNYSNNLHSSGRLVLYSMEADPISYIGLHYGEILRLNPAADAITNHRDEHKISATEIASSIDKLIKDYKGNNRATVIQRLFNIPDDNSINFSNIFATLALQLQKYDVKLDELQKSINSRGEHAKYPSIVSSSIQNSYGVEVQKTNVLSMVGNLVGGVLDFANEYGLLKLSIASGFGIIDHFNANHETDSFACIIDNKSHGVVKDVKLEITENSSKINCNGGNCTIEGTYNDRGVKINKATNMADYFGDNIVLTADVKNACVKLYKWESSSDNGKTWKSLGETTDNRLVIPASNLELGKAYKFRVSALYGDAFREVKTTFKNTRTHELEEAALYNANPTIQDFSTVAKKVSNINETRKATISNVVDLTLKKVVDKTPPTCTIPDSVAIKLKCRLLTCSDTSIDVKVSCTDSSGIGAARITSVKADQGGFVLIPSIEARQILDIILLDGNMKVKITAKRKPSWNKPFVTVTGEATDTKGNKAPFNKRIYVNISK